MYTQRGADGEHILFAKKPTRKIIDMLKVEIENYAQAMEVIAQLPANMQRKVFLPALRRSSKSMLAESRSRTPKHSGRLSESLEIVTVKKGRSANLAEVAIKPVFQKYVSGEINQYYGVMVHNGTQERTPKKKKFLKFYDIDSGKIIFTRSAAPIKANPFLKEAYEATERQVVDAFGGEVARATEKFINTKFK